MRDVALLRHAGAVAKRSKARGIDAWVIGEPAASLVIAQRRAQDDQQLSCDSCDLWLDCQRNGKPIRVLIVETNDRAAEVAAR